MKERLKRLLRSGSRISTQLHLAIWGAVALTICASLVAWLSFNRVGEVQSRVNEGSIPDIAASFEVAQYSGILVAAAPRLTTAATTEEFDEVDLSIDEAYSGFEEQLALLEEGTMGGESFARIRAHARHPDLQHRGHQGGDQRVLYADCGQRSPGSGVGRNYALSWTASSFRRLTTSSSM